MNHKILWFRQIILKGCDQAMQQLPKEYLYLFNTIVRTQQELRRLEETLIQAQQTAEELYLERTDEPAA